MGLVSMDTPRPGSASGGGCAVLGHFPSFSHVSSLPLCLRDVFCLFVHFVKYPQSSIFFPFSVIHEHHEKRKKKKKKQALSQLSSLQPIITPPQNQISGLRICAIYINLRHFSFPLVFPSKRDPLLAKEFCRLVTRHIVRWLFFSFLDRKSPISSERGKKKREFTLKHSRGSFLNISDL